MIEKIFNKLNISQEDYFLTGSRALDNLEINFLVSNKNSDYDYVLLIINRHILIEYLNEQKIEIDYSCYNGGFKFVYDKKIYNIITGINIEFMAWREALNILKYLITVDDKYKIALKNKFSRYCLYEQFRGLIKTYLRLSEIK